MEENPKITTLLEDNSGGYSTMRLCLLMWVIGMLLVFIVGTAKNGWKPVDMPDSIMIGLGVLAGAKTVQRYGENSPPQN